MSPSTSETLKNAIHDPNEFARLVAKAIDDGVAAAVQNIVVDSAQAAKFFISTAQTGDATEQSIAHGMGLVPTKVFVSIMDDASAVNVVFVEGTHDATNIKITAPLGVVYKVLAKID